MSERAGRSVVARALLLPGTGLLAVALLAGCGTTMVRGRVLDEAQQPVRGAAISTEPQTDLRITDQTGDFSIERTIDNATDTRPLPPGSYALTIKKLGFDDKTLPIELKKREELNLGTVVLVRKKLDVRVDDVEPGMFRGPLGHDMSYSPLRGE